MTDSRSTRRLVTMLTGIGALHFLAPKPFDDLIPERLPGSPRTWTLLSGVAELACAAAVAMPKTRRKGALATAALFVAVYPGNVKMAVDWRSRPLPYRAVAYGRLPMQVPLVLWALSVARSAD